eukprot:Sspe_Gene.12000::Locus_4081_Transcript_1_1_Confidence_1.000_Length_718::g.12000::m.12000
MDTLTPKLPLWCTAGQGILALAMGARMSAFRIQGILRKTPELFDSAYFKLWHKAQLNAAEYHGILVGMYLASYLGHDRNPSSLSKLGCLLGVVGSYIYCIAVVNGPQQRVRSPPVIRASGALMRYLSMAVLAADLLLTLSK